MQHQYPTPKHMARYLMAKTAIRLHRRKRRQEYAKEIEEENCKLSRPSTVAALKACAPSPNWKYRDPLNLKIWGEKYAGKVLKSWDR